DREPEGHRPHRKIIGGGERAGYRQHAGQHDECQPPSRRTGRRWVGWGLNGTRVVGHRSQNNRLRFKPIAILANSLPDRGYISVMVTAVASRHWTCLAAYFGQGPKRCPRC